MRIYFSLTVCAYSCVQVELNADFSSKITCSCTIDSFNVRVIQPDTDSSGRVMHQMVSGGSLPPLTLIHSHKLKGWNLCLIFLRASLVNWQKSTVMPSSYEVQTCMLKMSSGYTAKVKNMPWVGSNKGLHIKLEFVQVILISQLTLLLAGAAFPMLNFQLWQDFESWRQGWLFSTINNARSTRQTKVPLLFGWGKLAWQHDTWALPWCKAKSMRWWKGGPAVGNTCSLVVSAPMWAHWIYTPPPPPHPPNRGLPEWQ